MTKQIKNKETEVPNGMALNEKDYLTSLLTSLKDIEKNYVIAMSEASNEKLYDLEKDGFQKLSKLQREVYELMFQKGWYKLETVEDTKIEQKYNTLNQELNDLKN